MKTLFYFNVWWASCLEDSIIKICLTLSRITGVTIRYNFSLAELLRFCMTGSQLHQWNRTVGKVNPLISKLTPSQNTFRNHWSVFFFFFNKSWGLKYRNDVSLTWDIYPNTLSCPRQPVFANQHWNYFQQCHLVTTLWLHIPVLDNVCYNHAVM